MRILNAEASDRVTATCEGRRDVVEILEAGLQAADPYTNTKKLIRVEGNRLIVGGADYEPDWLSRHRARPSSTSTETGRILVVGAGKGVAARGARPSRRPWATASPGGHVIAKHGDDLILERIGVTFGAHPVPDEGCVDRVPAHPRPAHRPAP
jgi:glycerate 2-kinase